MFWSGSTFLWTQGGGSTQFNASGHHGRWLLLIKSSPSQFTSLSPTYAHVCMFRGISVQLSCVEFACSPCICMCFFQVLPHPINVLFRLIGIKSGLAFLYNYNSFTHNVILLELLLE